MVSMESANPAISSLLNTLDLLSTEAKDSGSTGTDLANHRTASALLLAKRKDDSLSRNAIKVKNSQTIVRSSKSSAIFENISTSSVDTPKYWRGPTKGSSNRKVKVNHTTKPRKKAHMKKREKGERYSEKREWKVNGKAK